MEKKYVVYKITNKINGKIYIGLTSNVKKRWGRNGQEYKPPKHRDQNGRPFWNAIKKYGWENFNKEIIEDNLTFEEACNREIYWIAFFDCTNKGYNVAIGGNGGRIYKEHPKGMLGKKHTQENKERHSKRCKDPNFNPMTNGKVVWGETHKHPRGMLGKTHSEEYKKRLSEEYRGDNSPVAKEVVAILDGMEIYYSTTNNCMNGLGISSTIFYKLIKSNEPFKPHHKRNYHLQGLTLKRAE